MPTADIYFSAHTLHLHHIRAGAKWCLHYPAIVCLNLLTVVTEKNKFFSASEMTEISKHAYLMFQNFFLYIHHVVPLF